MATNGSVMLCYHNKFNKPVSRAYIKESNPVLYPDHTIVWSIESLGSANILASNVVSNDPKTSSPLSISLIWFLISFRLKCSPISLNLFAKRKSAHSSVHFTNRCPYEKSLFFDKLFKSSYLYNFGWSPCFYN